MCGIILLKVQLLIFEKQVIFEMSALPVEVIHRIQSLMPPEEAANTCMLSKSWLRAWYTIPTLKIIPPHPDKLFSDCNDAKKYDRFVRTTLIRYHRDNMPIESFHLHVYTKGINLRVEDVKYWIQLAASRNCLKELSIKIGVFGNDTLILPNEIFSSQNLHIISVDGIHHGNMCLPVYPQAINSVFLRILDLSRVFINPDMFYNLLSTCTLLEKIILLNCEGLKKFKVKNLLHLNELEIVSKKKDDFSEINNVPRLWSFHYQAMQTKMKPMSFQIDSLASVTKLCIVGVMVDNSFFRTIESKFCVLEYLTLGIEFWKDENMVITSVSLKWLTLKLFRSEQVIDVQVNAPRLLSFNYDGSTKVIRKMMEWNTTSLKQVLLKNPDTGKWEACNFFVKRSSDSHW